VNVGVDLRQVRPVSTGGTWVFFRELVTALVGCASGDTFRLFQTRDDPPMLPPGAAAVEPIAPDEPRGAVDERAAALGLDALVRAFPAGFHGFPPERQVVFVPDLQHDVLPELFLPEVRRDRRRRFGAALAHAGAIATVSEFSRRTILAHPDRGCGDVFVVPGGPPAVRADAADGGGPPFETDRPYFIFPAKLWPHKNHGRLLRGFRQFLDESPAPMALLLTGDPRGWDALAGDADGLPVRHLGYVPDPELARLFRGATALVYVSLFEGFGLPLLEAFHYGVPVLGSDHGSLVEVAGDAMLTCDPTDPDAIAAGMLRIATDEALRVRLVGLGARRLRRYSWHRSAAALRNALQRVTRAAATGDAGGAPSAVPAGPELSVVITLTDHRGRGLASVESAVRRQECPRERFEVIVASDGADPDVAQAVRGVLGPRDRLLDGGTANGAALADLGARAAAGRLLFFTEGHCELAPGCVGELIGFFARGEHDAACVSYGARSAGAFARMEQRTFEEYFEEWRRPDDWRKVMFRGFAITREAYREAGGFEWAHGLFADRALSATLHAGGYRVGWAERAAVVHTNNTRYAELRASVEEYVAGEILYRETHDPDHCARYFGEPADGLERPDQARAALVAVARFLARHGSTLGALGPEAAGVLVAALLGRRWAVARAALAVARARLRYACARSDEGRHRAYASLWRRVARRARVRRLAARPAGARRPPVAARAVGVDVLPRHRAFGFHPLERWDGRPFRWTGPIAGLWLAVPPGRHRITVETAPLRPPAAVEAYWGGRRVAVVQRDPGALRLEVPGGAARPLVLVTPPVPRRLLRPGERRRLGLPVFGLRIEPAGARVGGGVSPSGSSGSSTRPS
jgi:glycosyltransferase involved in cell wall biosynthesis